MKIFAFYGVMSVVGFAIMGYATGFIQVRSGSSEFVSFGRDDATANLQLKFPQDLAAAARAQPVPEASAFDASAQSFPMAIMKPNGQLHPWQEEVPEEFQAKQVEATQLVLIVGGPTKHRLSIDQFVTGPPVERWQFEVEASVVTPQNGKVVAHQIFHNVPRKIRPKEARPLTLLGEPVQFQTVYHWAVAQARAGFPTPTAARPIVTIVD